jgi:hypothetical protein
MSKDLGKLRDTQGIQTNSEIPRARAENQEYKELSRKLGDTRYFQVKSGRESGYSGNAEFCGKLKGTQGTRKNLSNANREVLSGPTALK